MKPDKTVVGRIFQHFSWDALSKEEEAVLESGIEKHKSILLAAFLVMPIQIALCVVIPSVTMLITVVSFITLLVRGAWYTISFQNVSAAQLDAGVANFITKKMFRAFMLAFDMLIIGIISFVVRAMLPEIPCPPLEWWPLFSRIIILVFNLFWILTIWKDIYDASVGYDATDSLLGDGMPTLVRGAIASTANLPMLEVLNEILELMKKQTGEDSKES